MTVQVDAIDYLQWCLYVTEYEKTRLPHTCNFMTLVNHNLLCNNLYIRNYNMSFLYAIYVCVKVSDLTIVIKFENQMCVEA